MSLYVLQFMSLDTVDIYIYTYGYIIDKYSRVVVSTHEMGSCNKTHGMGLKPAHIQ